MATLTADRVVLNQQTSQARAEGNVRLERDGQTWSANFMEYNFRTKQFDRVHFHSPHKDRQKIDEQHHSDSNLTIQAAQIDVPMDAQILFHNAAQHQVTKSINILGQHE
jgi:lipopolysaccharide assembly outer membrane protein LptD (OstA)